LAASFVTAFFAAFLAGAFVRTSVTEEISPASR
jgi:hypothetical protein